MNNIKVVRIPTNSKTIAIDDNADLSLEGRSVHAWTCVNIGNVTVYVNQIPIQPNGHWVYDGNLSVSNGIAYVTVDITKVNILFDEEQQKALIANGDIVDKKLLFIERVI